MRNKGNRSIYTVTEQRFYVVDTYPQEVGSQIRQHR